MATAVKKKSEKSDFFTDMREMIDDLPIRRILIGDILRSRDYQPRVKIDTSAVNGYREIYSEAWAKGEGDFEKCYRYFKEALPPLVAFEIEKGDGKVLMLASGFTRIAAIEDHYHELEERKVKVPGAFAPVRVVEGCSEEDAVMFAAADNSMHLGVRMKREDFANAIKNVMRLNPKISISALSQALGKGISQATVGRIKLDLEKAGEVEASPTVVGKDKREVKRPAKTTPSKNGHTAAAETALGEKNGKHHDPEPVAPVKKGQVLLQDNKKPVPDHLLDAWKDEVIPQAQEFLRHLQTSINSATVTCHAYVRPAFFKAVETALEELRGALPAVEHAKCKGEGCKECKDTGFECKREWVDLGK